MQRLTDGTVQPSPLYGPNGVGDLIYSDSGHMWAMLADSSQERWASDGEPSQKELQSLYDHFIAYCGRYDVNETDGLVLHHIELHVTPNFVGAVFERQASLDGSRLTLRLTEEQLPAGMLEYALT